MKTNKRDLLPHTIITYPTSRSSSDSQQQHTTAPISSSLASATSSSNRSPSPINLSHPNEMADSTLVARARKTRYDNLPNFSGNPSDDAERFLKTIKNITKANDDSTDLQFLEIVRGKLTNSAGTWFDDHESQFTKWSEFETTFRTRYFSTTMIRTKFDKLTQRKQHHDESVTSYFDEIVTLCREVDPNMSDTVIIQHLMSGINPEFRRELSRRESAMQVLTEFLKHAKIEQDLHDTFSELQDVGISQTPPFATYHLSSLMDPPPKIQKSEHDRPNRNQWNRQPQSTTRQSSDPNRNSYARAPQNVSAPPPSFHSRKHNPPTRQHGTSIQHTRMFEYRPCRICSQRNHRSVDCVHRQQSGCYNCGENHPVSRCPKPPHFQ